VVVAAVVAWLADTALILKASSNSNPDSVAAVFGVEATDKAFEAANRVDQSVAIVPPVVAVAAEGIVVAVELEIMLACSTTVWPPTDADVIAGVFATEIAADILVRGGAEKRLEGTAVYVADADEVVVDVVVDADVVVVVEFDPDTPAELDGVAEESGFEVAAVVATTASYSSSASSPVLSRIRLPKGAMRAAIRNTEPATNPVI
jgi:hypothetical protein